MARPLQVLSLLSRFGALSVVSPASINGCRFASRSASESWTGQSHVYRDRLSKRASRRNDDLSDEQDALEDVEDKLQALVDERKKMAKTVKYHILRRKMTPSGAPRRKLTWSAMEQIRYLKQEQPEEWTVQRLAEGFSVTPDVILRVLRSKFVPRPERKAAQDAKVMAEVSQQVLLSGVGTVKGTLKLPGNHTAAALPAGRTVAPLVPVADQALMLRAEVSGSLAQPPAPVTPLYTQPRGDRCNDASVMRPEEDRTADGNLSEVDQVDEESWDGHVLTEEGLEELMDMEVENPSPVVQVGKDYFDAKGNFLYRI